MPQTGEAKMSWYKARMSGNGQGLVIEQDTGRAVAVTYDEKDAALVAAAPELLDALRLVLAHDGALTGADWTVIRAAIARAEGEG